MDEAARDKKIVSVLAWGRYLSWCDYDRTQLDLWLNNGPHDIDKSVDSWKFICLLSKAYASLYVVIEGWLEAKLSDKTIDDILFHSTQFTALLKRYRNGVFHYQPHLIEFRFIDFLSESEKTIPWAYTLHIEFLKFFWNYIHDPILTRQQIIDSRESIIGLIGWLPEGIPESYQWEMEQHSIDAHNLIEKFNDRDSPGAKDLLLAISECKKITEIQLAKYEEWIAEMIRVIKKENQHPNNSNVGLNPTHLQSS